MHRILCVEDAEDTLKILRATLRGYEVTCVRSVREATPYLASGGFALVLMDIMLPDGSGIDTFSEHAASLRGTPVVFLTGRMDFASKSAAFSLGAEDFIVKPFDPQELRLRVDAKIRRREAHELSKNILKIGEISCHLDEQRLVRESTREVIDLTSLEFRIFALLGKTPNKIFSRAEIIERAWGPATAITDRAVDVHVSNLRRKLAGSGLTVEAAVGAGYRLVMTNARDRIA